MHQPKHHRLTATTTFFLLPGHLPQKSSGNHRFASHDPKAEDMSDKNLLGFCALDDFLDHFKGTFARPP